jgi:hypothetical protein
MQTTKSGADRLEATSVRQNPQEGVLCLLEEAGLRLEPLGGGARQYEKRKRLSSPDKRWRARR